MNSILPVYFLGDFSLKKGRCGRVNAPPKYMNQNVIYRYIPVYAIMACFLRFQVFNTCVQINRFH